MKYIIDCTYTKIINEKEIHAKGTLEFECDHIPQTNEEQEEAERKMLDYFGFDSICVKRWIKGE